MHELSGASLLDELFAFLEARGMMQAVEQMRLSVAKRMVAVSLAVSAQRPLWLFIHEGASMPSNAQRD